jgi:ABC-2 type transport system ATP-binding protein
MDRVRTFQREGRTIVLVTHALDQVVDVCDRAVVLEGGRVVVDGTAREATRTLRDDFDAVREVEQQRVEVESRREAQVVSVEVIDDASGEPVEIIRSGQDIRVAVTVDSVGILEDWILGIGIETHSGQNIYGTNTQMLGVAMPDLRGTRRVELLLRDVYIGGGEYHVHGAIAQRSGPEIHRLSEAAKLKVESTGDSLGFLGITTTVPGAAPFRESGGRSGPGTPR